MFGRMMLTPILQVGRDADLQTAIASLLRATEQVWRYCLNRISTPPWDRFWLRGGLGGELCGLSTDLHQRGHTTSPVLFRISSQGAFRETCCALLADGFR